MTTRNEFGQYCPLSLAAQILGKPWTLLVLREILLGYSTFNDISRGIPLMSRTLLSERLKQLETAGLISKQVAGPGRAVCYAPSKAGEALGPILKQIAVWGQEWIDTEPSLEDIDTDVLMWDIRANVRPLPSFPERFVVRFHFPDGPELKTEHWLIFENGEIDVCYIDPGYDVDVHIETKLKDMVRVWMGWLDLDQARCDDVMQIYGPIEFTRDVRSWLGLSGLANIEKRPASERVLRNASGEAS